jgi:ATP-dependent Lhr-like helicase
VAFYRWEHVDTWRALAQSATGADDADALAASETALAVAATLARRGPSFLATIEQDVLAGVRGSPERGASTAHLEVALLELVGAGRLTADAFAAARGLLARPAKWGVTRLARLAAARTGRWSLLPRGDALDDPVARDRAVERHARALLRRYGVVVRHVAQRESSPGASLRWSELLRVLRRLEARGEVRGGYFVQGAGGEHFALPEAVARLREVAARGPCGELVAISAADPLNLTGVLDEGPRIASRGTSRVLLEDGEALAALDGRRVTPLRSGRALTEAHAAVLRADLAPAALAAFT